MNVSVDGVSVDLDPTPATSLLRALRDAGITGPTGACEQGECGSCSVLLDGDLVCSCLVPAAVCDGARVDTVHGLVRPDLAEALERHGAVQCGFCTPGFVVAAEAALDGPAALDRESVVEAISGNLCRCTGYHRIIAAVLEVDGARRA